MKKTVACVLSACALLAGGAAMQRASAQERTQTPGQSTRANVWIQNRGNGEAVPVSIEKVGAESPLRVEVTGVPRVVMDSGSALQVGRGHRLSRSAITAIQTNDFVRNGESADSAHAPCASEGEV